MTIAMLMANTLKCAEDSLARFSEASNMPQLSERQPAALR